MLGPSLQTEAQFHIEVRLGNTVKISVSALCKAVQEMMQEQASRKTSPRNYAPA